MTDNRRQNERECDPATDNPGGQPKPPEYKTCDPFDDPKAPDLPKPPECPPSDCKCPKAPPTVPGCLETAILDQAAAIAAAESAKAFKTELEAQLAKAKAGAQDYSQDTYDRLKKTWLEQDARIARLIHQLTCAIKCWRCVVECYLCPMLEDFRQAEFALYGDDRPPSDLHNWLDLEYWRKRDRDAKGRRRDRIKDVLGAWDKPGATIDRVQNEIAKAIEAAEAAIGSGASKVVVDVFMNIVPKHLAIAPPADSGAKTRIDKKYTDLCKCDTGTPDDCCGPDVGIRPVLHRFIGPLPYLIAPNRYYDVICCLVKHRYLPAKKALEEAEGELAKVADRIKALQVRTAIKPGETFDKFLKDAKAAIPAAVNCCDFEKDGGDSTAS
jgi:hypothetical protein